MLGLEDIVGKRFESVELVVVEELKVGTWTVTCDITSHSLAKSKEGNKETKL